MAGSSLSMPKATTDSVSESPQGIWTTALSSREAPSLITRKDDLWYFINKKNAEQILALQIMIDEGFGLRQEYEYSIDNPETDIF